MFDGQSYGHFDDVTSLVALLFFVPQSKWANASSQVINYRIRRVSNLTDNDMRRTTEGSLTSYLVLGGVFIHF